MMERKRTIAWALFKTAVFTLVVPGTVGVLIPRWLLSEEGRNEALPPISWRWIGLLPLVAGACIYLVCAWDFAVTGLGTPAPIDMPESSRAFAALHCCPRRDGIARHERSCNTQSAHRVNGVCLQTALNAWNGRQGSTE